MLTARHRAHCVAGGGRACFGRPGDPGIFPASYIERIAGTNINESLHQSASRAWLYEHASHARLERLVEEWNAREREQKLLLALRWEELHRRQHGAGREDA